MVLIIITHGPMPTLSMCSENHKFICLMVLCRIPLKDNLFKMPSPPSRLIHKYQYLREYWC